MSILLWVCRLTIIVLLLLLSLTIIKETEHFIQTYLWKKTRDYHDQTIKQFVLRSEKAATKIQTDTNQIGEDEFKSCVITLA